MCILADIRLQIEVLAYLQDHRCESIQTKTTNQTAGSWQGTRPRRKRSSAIFYRDQAKRTEINLFRWIFKRSISCKQCLVNWKVPSRKTSGPRTWHHCEHSPACASWIQPRTRLAHSADKCSSLDGKYRFKRKFFKSEPDYFESTSFPLSCENSSRCLMFHTWDLCSFVAVN